jgi:hypothetical protein
MTLGNDQRVEQRDRKGVTDGVAQLTVLKPQVLHYPKLLASPTGFEPVSPA